MLIQFLPAAIYPSYLLGSFFSVSSSSSEVGLISRERGDLIPESGVFEPSRPFPTGSGSCEDFKVFVGVLSGDSRFVCTTSVSGSKEATSLSSG